MLSFSRSDIPAAPPPATGPRRARRAAALPAVMLASVLLALAATQTLHLAEIDRAARLGAARAEALSEIAHDLDANIAYAMQTGAMPSLATIPVAQAVPLESLGGSLPTAATSPLPVLPSDWTVIPYVASLTAGGSARSYGVLYVVPPASELYALPALERDLVTLQSGTPGAENAAASDLVAAAIGHRLNPATEIAFFTASYAGLDGRAVLRSPRAGLTNVMSAPLNMAGHSLTAGPVDAASGTVSGTMLTSDSAVIGTVSSPGPTTLTAADFAVASALAASRLAVSGSLAALTLTAGTVGANNGQIGQISSTTATGQNATISSLDVNGTLTATGAATVTGGGNVANIVRGDQGNPGTVSAASLSTSWVGATAATISHLSVSSCTGCKP